ncbi:MAG: thioredoxin domain-containing protein [Campylobacter sp.]|nr:thioredoxin domain-containing protein [Campylobacter sp.]
MKKSFLKVICAVFCLFSFAFCEQDERYIVLENPIENAENSLIEIFSYDCPFCYKFDEVIKKIMCENTNLKFIPYHLATRGEFGVLGSEIFANLIAYDNNKSIDLFDELSEFNRAKKAIFAAYHEKKERWGGVADENGKNAFLQTALANSQISNFKFENNSTAVSEILNSWGLDKNGKAYEIAKILGVPAFVINGKYLIKTGSLRSFDDMAKLVKELSLKD